MKAVWHEENESLVYPCRLCGRCELGCAASEKDGLCPQCESAEAFDLAQRMDAELRDQEE